MYSCISYRQAGDDQEVLESPGLQIGGGLPDPKARGAAVRKEQDPPSDPQASNFVDKM